MNRAILICQLLFFTSIFGLSISDISAQTASRSRRSTAARPVSTVTIGSLERSRSTSEVEREVFDLINHERQKRGLPALIWSDRVAKVARQHSKNMASQGFFSHRGKDGTTVSDRANRAGVKWHGIGENIVYFNGSRDPVTFATKCWMDSHGHKQNILNKNWQESGIGAVMTSDGTYYLTQVFLLH